MSGDVLTLCGARGRTIWNALRQFRKHSTLKIIVIVLFSAGLWSGLYWLFTDGLRFLGTPALIDYRPIIVQYIFAVFFLSLLVMLMFSNGIILYASLFRSDETAFLIVSPSGPGHIFTYKLLDALAFSSWAFLFLGLPLVVALGVEDKAPWYYYIGATLFFGTFAMIPAAAASFVVLLLARFLSRSPKRVFIFLLAVAAIPLALWGFGVMQAWKTGMTRGEEVWVPGVLGKLRLSLFVLLPSYWTSDGVLSLSRGDFAKAGFNYLLLLSTALFIGMLSIQLARLVYLPAYHRTHSLLRRRRGRAGVGFYHLLDHLPLMSDELRAMIVKDAKGFFRDPAQWSQVLIFFGLLGIYFLNMRSFQYDFENPFWRNLISVLNLVATSLTLSTFTSRFIYPLLSLEGRKFWILGLLPLDRRNLLYSKFWFAFIGAFVISESLIVVSDIILRLETPAIVLHAAAVLIICAGLSGLAVGIGALYPNLKEDNPSKIVSGFGGTLNLVLSVLFVAIIIVCLALPYHLAEMGHDFGLRIGVLAGWIGALVSGALAVAVPLALGVRAFEKLEV